MKQDKLWTDNEMVERQEKASHWKLEKKSHKKSQSVFSNSQPCHVINYYVQNSVDDLGDRTYPRQPLLPHSPWSEALPSAPQCQLQSSPWADQRLLHELWPPTLSLWFQVQVVLENHMRQQFSSVAAVVSVYVFCTEDCKPTSNKYQAQRNIKKNRPKQ